MDVTGAIEESYEESIDRRQVAAVLYTHEESSPLGTTNTGQGYSSCVIPQSEQIHYESLCLPSRLGRRARL